MSGTRMDFSEINKLSADLSKAGEGALAKAKLAVQKTSADIAKSAAQAAPVDTGNLRNSIGSDLVDTGGAVWADIGPTANYGKYVEYGTSRMAPQPYLVPAFEQHTNGFSKAIESIGGSIL